MDPSRLGVIARTSAMQFKKTTKRADQIGSELGVSHLLEGSVRTTGSRIRIAVQLIETRHESQLWAEQYERDARDVLTLQREVAEAIARQITTSLAVAPSNVNADARRHSTIAEAYEHYLRGRYHWSKDTADGLAEGDGAFSQSHRAGRFIRARVQRPGGYLHVARQRWVPADERGVPAWREPRR